MEREEEGKEYGRSVGCCITKYKKKKKKKIERRERERPAWRCVLGSPNNATRHTVPIIQSVAERLLSVSLLKQKQQNNNEKEREGKNKKKKKISAHLILREIV